MKTIALELKPADAEPILREAARKAALYGAWCDYITRRTANSPANTSPHGDWFETSRKDWMVKFLEAKRVVEAFGVEYQPTSEEEALTVTFETIGEKTKVVDVGGPIGKVRMRTGGTPDYKHPKPSYRGSVHEEACRHAADRTVRAWQATLG